MSAGDPLAAPAGFDPVAYLNAPRWRASKPGLERIAALADELGRPQDSLRFVHVAGTNGKGSICAYLAAILRASGFKTGLFTSPYIERFEDRIRVDGEQIGSEELLAATLRVREAARAVEERLGEHPTEFELMCAVALVHFQAAGCDICVMETGLGGRLDATNIIMPDVSVIARIGFDHTELLGETLSEIAAEKAGIIKEGRPVVSWPQERHAMEVIEDVCASRGCALTMPAFDRLDAGALDMSSLARSFRYEGSGYATHLLGSCQPQNASIAVEAARALRRCGWDVSDEALRVGIEHAVWPGRFEVLEGAPLAVVDGAHNPQGAEALAESLRELLAASGRAEDAVSFVMGVLADKDYEYMIEPLVPFASSFAAYAPDNPRALAADDLARAIRRQAPPDVPVQTAASPEAAVELALAQAGAAGCVVACGTLYSVARIKRCLLAIRSAGIS